MPVFQIPRGIDYMRYAPLFRGPDIIGAEAKAVSVAEGLMRVRGEKQRQEHQAELHPLTVATAALNVENLEDTLIRNRESHLSNIEKQRIEMDILKDNHDYIQSTRDVELALARNEDEKARLNDAARKRNEARDRIALTNSGTYSTFRQLQMHPDPALVLREFGRLMSDPNITGDNKNAIEGIMNAGFDKRQFKITDANGNEKVITGFEVRSRSATAEDLDAFVAQHDIKEPTPLDFTRIQALQNIERELWYIEDPEEKKKLVAEQMIQFEEQRKILSEQRKLISNATTLVQKEQAREQVEELDTIGNMPSEILFERGILRTPNLEYALVEGSNERLKQIAQDLKRTNLDPDVAERLQSASRILSAIKVETTLPPRSLSTAGRVVTGIGDVFGQLWEVATTEFTRDEYNRAVELVAKAFDVKNRVNSKQISQTQGVMELNALFDAVYNDTRTPMEKTLDALDNLEEIAGLRERGTAGARERLTAREPRVQPAIQDFPDEASARAAGFTDGQMVSINGKRGFLAPGE